MVHKLNQTSQKILREAQSGKIFLLDGATGTFLQNNGLEACLLYTSDAADE